MTQCSCGSGQAYANCCGRFIEDHQIPTTPEELMRSRYTAYTQANVDYIAKTMRSPAADNFDKDAAKKWANQAEWLKLEVIDTSIDGKTGFVEFIAHYQENRARYRIHELSEFQQINGHWYYITGTDLGSKQPLNH